MPSLWSSRSLTQVCFSLLLARVTKIYKYKQSDKPIEMKMFSRRSLKTKTNSYHECSPGWHPVGGRGSCSLPSLHHDHAPHLLLHHTLQHLHHLGEVSPPPRSTPSPLLKHNSTLENTSKSYFAPHNFNFFSFPQPRDRSINFTARIQGSTAWQSRIQWYIFSEVLY